MRGFGFIFDTQTGAVRNWYAGADGVQRWADSDQPVYPSPDRPQEPIDANQEGAA